MRTEIQRVHPEGIVLSPIQEDKSTQLLWLPAEEWPDTSQPWQEAYEILSPGDELDVVLTERVNPKDGKRIVSSKNLSVRDIGSVQDFQPRFMKVNAITKKMFRGLIGNVPAVVFREEYDSYLDSKGLNETMADHGAIGEGDWIGGTARDRYATAENIDHVVLEASEYLEMQNTKVTGHFETQTTEEQRQALDPEISIHTLSAFVTESISPLLLVDNDENIVKNWGFFLEKSGVKVSKAGTAEEARALINQLDQHATTGAPFFRMAIIDANLTIAGDDLDGMPVAVELARRGDCNVIIMSGEDNHERKRKEWPDLMVRGYAIKPLNVEEFLNLIKEALWTEPRPLSELIPQEQETREQTPLLRSNPAFPDAFPTRTVTGLVRELAHLIPGTVVHLFRIHPRSGRALSIAHHGESFNWEPFRGKVRRSPIGDAAFADQPIFENASDRGTTHSRSHEWTLRMMRYDSFCGIKLDVVDNYRYALVAFHPERDAFDPEFRIKARLAAERIARALEEERVRLGKWNEAVFVTTGMAFASLAHELNSDMFAIVPSAEMLRDLLMMKRNLTDEEKDEAYEQAVSLAEGVNSAQEKTKILRGLQAHTQLVSILDCLLRASEGCRKVLRDSLRNPDRVLIEPVLTKGMPDWRVKAVPAGLIMTFFNVYLNAAQQIELASRMRKDGRIWHTCEPRIDREQKSWLYVRIHDTGPGIHPEDWESVFKPGTTTKPGGSGLGLYICRQLLERIRDGDRRASIFVSRSVLWDGTTFTIKLPIIT